MPHTVDAITATTATTTADYAAIRAHLDAPRATVFVPDGPHQRLADVEPCVECAGTGRRLSMAITRASTIYERRATGWITDCSDCRGTGRTNTLDPDDPLAGLSPSCAHIAVREACWMVLPILEDASDLRHWREALSGGLPEVDWPRLSGEPEPANRADLAIRWWVKEVYARDRGYTVDARSCRRDAMECAQAAGLDLAKWNRRVRAVLAFRDVATAELEVGG